MSILIPWWFPVRFARSQTLSYDFGDNSSVLRSAYQCPLPWCHLLKVNSIRSSPCHGQCQLGQEHSDFVIFGTQGVRKLPKNWRNINMSAYFDQKWLRSRVFCSQPTSCNILPQRSQTRNSRGACFAGKVVKVSPVFASAIILLISITTFSLYHDFWG